MPNNPKPVAGVAVIEYDDGTFAVWKITEQMIDAAGAATAGGPVDFDRVPAVFIDPECVVDYVAPIIRREKTE